MGIWRTIAAIAAMGFVLIGAAFAQERLAIPGSVVSLVPPEGFTLADDFTGYVDFNSKSGIVVMDQTKEMYAQLTAVLDEVASANETLARDGISIDTVQHLSTDSGAVLLVLHGKQQQSGRETDKWIVVAGPEPAAILTFNLSADRVPDDAAILASIKSLEFGVAPTLQEQLAAMRFVVTPLEPFTHIRTATGSTIGLATFEGVDKSGLLPLAIFAWQLGGGPVDDAEAAARKLLFGTTDLGEAEIEETGSVTFAGVEGIKLSGRYQRLGTDMRFVQYLSLIDGRTVRLVAMMPEAEAETLLPVIEMIAQSARWNDK